MFETPVFGQRVSAESHISPWPIELKVHCCVILNTSAAVHCHMQFMTAWCQLASLHLMS